MAAAKVSGFFSSLKKEVLTIGQTKTVDASFDTAKTNFDAFVFAVQTMKAHMDAWLVHAKGMSGMGEHLGNDYKNVMQQLSTHPFSALATEGKATGNAMYKTFEACEKELEATAMSEFKQLTAHFAALKERMKAREAARLDFDYRTAQVKSAHADRDKALAKGKAEAPKDAEKRVAAEKKLEDSSNAWNTINAAVISDLIHLHDTRHALLGNIYIHFLTVQKQWLNAYANTIDNLSIPAVPPALAFNLHPNDAKAAPADGLADVSLGNANGNPFGAAPTNKPPPPYAAVSAIAGVGAAAGGGAAGRPAPPGKPAPVAGGAAGAAAAGSIAAQALYPDALHAAAAAPSSGVAIGANFADDDMAAMRR